MDNSVQVLSGVKKALLANPTLIGLVSNRFYFTIPQPTVFPYVLISIQSTPEDRKTETSMDYQVRIQAFSRTLDQLEVLNIKSEIFNTLHRNESSINITGLYQCLQQGVNITMKESDGITWQSTVDYHLKVDG